MPLLTADAPRPHLWFGGMDRDCRRIVASCSRTRDAQYLALRSVGPFFRSAGANLLEFARIGFHYSVIGCVEAAKPDAGFFSIAHRLPASRAGNGARCFRTGTWWMVPQPKHASSKSEPATGRSMQKTFKAVAR